MTNLILSIVATLVLTVTGIFWVTYSHHQAEQAVVAERAAAHAQVIERQCRLAFPNSSRSQRECVEKGQ